VSKLGVPERNDLIIMTTVYGPAICVHEPQ
jgi:hypothetical protein